MLSIIIPVYNSESTLALLVNDLERALEEIQHEVILVNDGSRDASAACANELCITFSNIKCIHLRRNFGEFNAVMCGLNHTIGNYVAIIDDDFQNPPSEIIKLLNHAKAQALDVVYASYEKKEHSLFRNLGSRFFNFMISQLIDKPRHLYLSSFKVISKEVVKEIIRYKGPYPFIDALIFSVTQNVGSLPVAHQKRSSARSNYTLRRLVSLFLNLSIVSSSRPLRILFLTGWLFVILGIAAVLFELVILYFFEHLYKAEHIVWITLVLVMGLQFFAMGLVGEYIGKILMTQSGWPQYVIKSTSFTHDREET
jgi:undecaprenyl-phosphate 4-deoxy-4-formamido-L-arabinose transferase